MVFFNSSCSHKKTSTHLLHDKAVANGAFLALVCGSVVEVIHLTFVTLITHEALAAVTGAITATLHGDGAHRVTVTGWWGRRWGGGKGRKEEGK